MSAPTKPIRDSKTAGEFARKFFGPFGKARVREVKIPSCPGRSFKVYEVGMCPEIGDFYVRGDSSHDFAEAFEKAGYPLDARDPLFLRQDLRYCNELAGSKPEQVEIAL